MQNRTGSRLRGSICVVVALRERVNHNQPLTLPRLPRQHRGGAHGLASRLGGAKGAAGEDGGREGERSPEDDRRDRGA